MARGFLYVYERIYKGETEMQTEFRKIPVNGKRTSVADQKRVRKARSYVLIRYHPRAQKALATYHTLPPARQETVEKKKSRPFDRDDS